tara:strand:+ start:953 stop:1504 length:552 start_codon:yes stop_codon:yes gene_type:complete
MTKEINHKEMIMHLDRIANKMYDEGGDTWIETFETGDKFDWIVAQDIKSKRGATMRFKDHFKRDELVLVDEDLSYDPKSEFLVDEAEGDEDAAVPSSVVPSRYKERYGTKANCGDELANCLDGIDSSSDAWSQLAADNGIDWSRWSHLNNGMRRMNLGNVLRNMAKKGTRLNLEAAYTAQRAG